MEVDAPLAHHRSGEIERDSAQELAAEKLNLLHRRLKTYRTPEPEGGGLLARIGLNRSARPAEPPSGLYMFGGIGRGKSMVIDLFFDAAPVVRKRRVHFHAFMLEVHERIRAWRKAGRAGGTRIGADPIPPTTSRSPGSITRWCSPRCRRSVPRSATRRRASSVTLIDALYEHRVNLVCSAAVAPDALCPKGDGAKAFKRTVSRLHETQSDAYLAAPHLT